MKRIVRNYVPLPHAKVKKIAAILTDAWEMSPSQKAAQPLGDIGFNELVEILTNGGDATGQILRQDETTLTNKQMAKELRKQGKYPAQFFLDDDGNEIE